MAANDLVQGVFLELPDALHRFDGHDFRAWLTMRAARCAYRHGRRNDPEPAADTVGLRRHRERNATPGD